MFRQSLWVGTWNLAALGSADPQRARHSRSIEAPLSALGEEESLAATVIQVSILYFWLMYFVFFSFNIFWAIQVARGGESRRNKLSGDIRRMGKS